MEVLEISIRIRINHEVPDEWEWHWLEMNDNVTHLRSR